MPAPVAKCNFHFVDSATCSLIPTSVSFPLLLPPLSIVFTPVSVVPPWSLVSAVVFCRRFRCRLWSSLFVFPLWSLFVSVAVFLSSEVVTQSLSLCFWLWVCDRSLNLPSALCSVVKLTKGPMKGSPTASCCCRFSGYPPPPNGICSNRTLCLACTNPGLLRQPFLSHQLIKRWGREAW